MRDCRNLAGIRLAHKGCARCIYDAKRAFLSVKLMVGDTGLEPVTSCMSSKFAPVTERS